MVPTLDLPKLQPRQIWHSADKRVLYYSSLAHFNSDAPAQWRLREHINSTQQDRVLLAKLAAGGAAFPSMTSAHRCLTGHYQHTDAPVKERCRAGIYTIQGTPYTISKHNTGWKLATVDPNSAQGHAFLSVFAWNLFDTRNSALQAFSEWRADYIASSADKQENLHH